MDHDMKSGTKSNYCLEKLTLPSIINMDSLPGGCESLQTRANSDCSQNSMAPLIYFRRLCVVLPNGGQRFNTTPINPPVVNV
jgi:hypothetical protein